MNIRAYFVKFSSIENCSFTKYDFDTTFMISVLECLRSCLQESSIELFTLPTPLFSTVRHHRNSRKKVRAQDSMYTLSTQETTCTSRSCRRGIDRRSRSRLTGSHTSRYTASRSLQSSS